MPIENKDSFVTGHYKQHEQKIMKDAAEKERLKKKEDFLNETITLTRKELLIFKEEIIIYHDENEISKKLLKFINKEL